MERFALWYCLQLKAWVQRTASWFLVAAMLILVLLTRSIAFPNETNLSVGVVMSDEAHSAEIIAALNARDSIFIFLPCENEDELKKLLLSGKLECGFSFSANFSDKFEAKEIKDLVSYWCTPFTTKGKVAKETFFISFYQVYSKELIKANAKRMVEQDDIPINEAMSPLDSEMNTLQMQEKYDDMLRLMLNHNEEYLTQEKTYLIESKLVDPFVPPASTQTSATYPLQGMVGLLLFFFMLLSLSNKYAEKASRFTSVLSGKEAFLFETTGILAAGTIPAFLGLLIILFLPESRGTIQEIISMLLFLGTSSLWICLLGKWIKSMTSFVSCLLSMLLIHLVMCPVFVDLADIVPALRYVRLLFPLGTYLL